MNIDSWLTDLSSNLNLPTEYIEEIQDEYRSHLYQEGFNNNFDKKQFGSIYLISKKIMKSKNLSLVDYLKLASTWKLVVVILFGALVPLYLTVFYTIVYVVIYGATSINDPQNTLLTTSGLATVVVTAIVLVVIIFFCLKFTTKYIKKHNDSKQIDLAYAIGFLLVLLYMINGGSPSGLAEFIYTGSTTTLLTSATINLVAVIYVFVAYSIMITMSKAVKMKGNVATILVKALFTIVCVSIFLFLKDASGNAIATNLASKYMPSIDYLSKNFHEYLDHADDYDYRNDSNLSQYDAVIFHHNENCWSIDGGGEGCEYRSEKAYILDESCREWGERQKCNVLTLYEHQDGIISYNLTLRDFVSCNRQEGTHTTHCGIINY